MKLPGVDANKRRKENVSICQQLKKNALRNLPIDYF